jgi:hypothetical protein
LLIAGSSGTLSNRTPDSGSPSDFPRNNFRDTRTDVAAKRKPAEAGFRIGEFCDQIFPKTISQDSEPNAREFLPRMFIAYSQAGFLITKEKTHDQY